MFLPYFLPAGREISFASYITFHIRYNLKSYNHLNVATLIIFTIVILIIIFINCNWVVTRWQWLFNTYTKYEIGLLLNLRREGYMRSM
jgi:hypothetical protein